MIKKILITLAVIALILFGGLQVMMYQTRKASPAQTENHTVNGKTLTIDYCSPSMRGRQIMDSLVPYGKIWRTGANEATTFQTTGAIEIQGSKLPEGTYTIWTIPNKDNWEIIFNNKEYGWGLNWDGTTPYESEFDVVKIAVAVEQLDSPQENFKIEFEGDTFMTLSWEKTKVRVPIVM